MKITREMIYRQMLLHETINSTAESYFHSCRFPCADQCMLELQVSSVATDKGTYLMNTINNILNGINNILNGVCCYYITAT